MSTNVLSPYFLLHITLCSTEEPAVSRILSVPSEMTFTELHEAIAAAFGWGIEPCASWIFKMVDRNPLIVMRRDDSQKPKTRFAAYWTAPDQGYNVAPAQYGTRLAVGLCVNGQVRIGKYWTYDYNISKHPHAIKVIDTLADDPYPKLTCVGGIGRISRKAWQFADHSGLESRVKAGGGAWVSDIAAPNAKMREIQENFELRKRKEADLAAEPHHSSKKRAAPSRSATAEADGANLWASRLRKRRFIF